ncbi:hypothetical protein MOQ_003635 [Trypanosoma cruzi marinkellei]|uniref:Uncharacterized protein n=1 Tax=Trypanosoma cruzi marinkellei TaxID=85056 RepID=K2NU72_TRYCR|nr:hypothetical protein MOQ_003635 [Trypanosoma cruzi marinkellei]
MFPTLPILDDRVLALLIALCTLVSYLGSLYWWQLVPRLFYPEERKIEEKIALLRAEAERCNNTDQLHLHGKITRQIQLLIKELAQTRNQRFSLCCSQNRNKTGNHERRWLLLGTFFARLKYFLPTFIDLLISFGFMIPFLYLFGNRPAVVAFPRCFRHCLPSLMNWIEAVVMSVLLGPLLWSSKSHSCANGSSWEANRHNLLHAHGRNSDVSGFAFSDTAGPNGLPQTADGRNDGEIKSLGLVAWFLVCYFAVRFSHRVLLR